LGLTITSATGINSSGQIVAEAFNGVDEFGVILTPDSGLNAVPEPGSLTLVGLGFLSLACGVYCRRRTIFAQPT
jgi:hypothetical protein